MTETATYQTIATPDGPFTLLVDARQRVVASGWSADLDAIVDRLGARGAEIRASEIVAGETSAAVAVRAYYDGDLQAITDVPVRQFGTPFRQEGWAALREIPAGQVLTYTEFAARLGRPQAVRAAASVCATNAPALFVPCHRVQRSDGSLGGFAWGTEVKRRLLDREKAIQGLHSDNSQA